MSASQRKFYDPMDDLLDRPIAFNPAFKRITGNTVAGIFLSQAWYWSKRHKGDDGWFYKSGIEWEEETGLSRSEQETARRHCLSAGVMEEKLKGVPATLYFRVLKPKVYELLGVQFAGMSQTEIGGNQQAGMQGDGEQDGDNPANLNKESEIPPEIPPENGGEPEKTKTLELFERAASSIWPLQDSHWRNLRRELEQAQLSQGDHVLHVAGMGMKAAVYQARYARTFERALLGILNENVIVSFEE